MCSINLGNTTLRQLMVGDKLCSQIKNLLQILFSSEMDNNETLKT